MFPTLILSSFVGVCLPEEAVDRLVSTRTVVVQRQVMLEFKVLTGDPLGSVESGTQKHLAAPNMTALHKQTATFLAGAGDQGIEIKATPRLRLDGKIGVECETSVHTRKVHSGIRFMSGSFAEGVDTEMVKTSAVLTPSKPIKVRLSAKSATDQTWVELTAKVVDSPLVAAPALVPPPPLATGVTQATYKVPVASRPQTVCPEAALFPTPMAYPAPTVPALMPPVLQTTPAGK